MSLVVNETNVSQPPMMPIISNKLFVVIGGLALGGAERIVLDWARRVHPKWEVTVVVFRNNSKEWEVPSFINVIRLNGSRKRLQKVAEEISCETNSVCVCHLIRKKERDILEKSGVFTIPVLHNAANGWLEDSESLNTSARVIAVSQACSDDLQDTNYDGDISIIRHLPHSRKFASDSREKILKSWNIPSDATVIGMIGGVKPQKAYPTALRILKAFQKKQDAYLVILGGPIGKQGRESWNAIMQQIKYLGLRNRVAMPGFIQDAVSFVPAFDVVLNTSSYEGLSIATLETVASGVPVVATKVGGQGEISASNLTLLPEESLEKEWVDALESAIAAPKHIPSWTRFSSYRLWTLNHIVRPYKPSSKVLFVTANLNSGGAQRSLVNLTTHINSDVDLDIAVTGNSSASHFFQQLKDKGVNVFRTDSSRDCFDHSEKLLQYICENKVSTVCFWNVDPKIKLLLTKALSFLPTKLVDVSPGGYAFQEMDTIDTFQKLVAFSSTEFYYRLDKLVLKFTGPYPKECEGKVTFIPNGVVQPSRKKQDYQISENPRIIVNGRIAPSKFIVEIIQAMDIVWKDIPNVQLHFYGASEAKEAEYAKQVMEESGKEINKMIYFHGMDFYVSEKMVDFDGYIVLGKHQGCPNALLEAMVAGLPCITNNSGGAAEQVIHGKTGILLQDIDVLSIATALIKIVGDREYAKILGENAQKHVTRNFSMDQMVENYQSVFSLDEVNSKTFANCWKSIFSSTPSKRRPYYDCYAN